jgi:hypothetical protein
MDPNSAGTKKSRLSFRGLIVLLYLGTLIPLLTLIGLVVYRTQQNFLITETRDRLTGFVQAGVSSLTPGADLTNLSVALGEHLRVLGAALFVKDATGRPVPPALGTGPWLDDAAHRSVREQRTGSLQTIPAGSSRRLVYLVPILDVQGNVLGTVEASLPLDTIESELAALRRWLGSWEWQPCWAYCSRSSLPGSAFASSMVCCAPLVWWRKAACPAGRRLRKSAKRAT